MGTAEPFQQVIDLVVNDLLAKFASEGFKHVMISLIDRQVDEVRALRASGDFAPIVDITHRRMFTPEGKATEDVLVRVVKTGAGLDVEDCEDPKYQCDLEAARRMVPPLRQMAVRPLIARESGLGFPESDAFGTVQVGRLPIPLDPTYEAALKRLVQEAAAELECALLASETWRASRHHWVSLELFRKVGAHEIDDPGKALQGIVETVAEHLGAMACSVRIRDERFNDLSYWALYAPLWDPGFVLNRYPIDNSSTGGWIVKNQKPLINADVTLPGVPYKRKPTNTRSNCGVPIWVRGRVEGALVVDSDRPGAFPIYVLNILGAVAGVVSAAISGGEAIARDRVRENLNQVFREFADWPSQLGAVAEVARSALLADHCSLFLKTELDPTYYLRATTFQLLRHRIGIDWYAEHEGRTGWVIGHRRNLRIPARMDLATVRQFYGEDLDPSAKVVEYNTTERAGERAPNPDIAYIAVPVMTDPDAECWGVIRCVSEFQKGGASRNFTHQKEQLLSILAQELAISIERRALRQLRERKATQQNMERAASRVSHKLKNPASGLLARVRKCEELIAGRNLESFPEHFARIREHTKKITRIAKEFEKLTKPLDECTTLVDLPVLVAEIVRRANGEAEGVETRVGEPPAGFPQVLVNADYLEDCFDELVANARQELAGRGGLIQITFDGPFGASQRPVALMRTSYVVVTIADNARGVKEEMKEKIFDPLETTRVDGTGLGLAIVRRYVEHMGGWIVEDGKHGEGARFRLALPLPR